ncbi:MAG: hypothetical protein JST28_09210 [Acidobacteria bacterium]|nr:hypothetical protein [Acidobacteriota bacterium]
MRETGQIAGLRNERKACHFWVDNEVADCYQAIIGADAIWVYCRIARYANGAWIVSPRLRGTMDRRVGLREMAEWCGKSVDTVWRCLELLELVGLIKSERNAKSKGCYALADVKDLVIREGGQYDREVGAYRLPDSRVAELKAAVKELKGKLARKAVVPCGTTVAHSDSSVAPQAPVQNGQCDSSVAPDAQNCTTGATANNSYISKTSKPLTPPNPLASEGEVSEDSGATMFPEFTPEQLEHLARVRQRGEDAAFWERHYREENEAQAREARARIAELARRREEFPDCARAVKAVMRGCGFVAGDERNKLPGVLLQVLTAEWQRVQRPPWITGPDMIEAWHRRKRSDGPRYGPLKFYRDGHWLGFVEGGR